MTNSNDLKAPRKPNDPISEEINRIMADKLNIYANVSDVALKLCE